MADTVRISIRMFIEAAIRFSGWKCPECNTTLELIWIGEEEDPDLNYVHCPSCEGQFDLIVAFLRDNDIPEGR